MSLRKPDLPTIRRTSLSVLTLMLALLTVAAMPPARAQGGDAIVVQGPVSAYTTAYVVRAMRAASGT